MKQVHQTIQSAGKKVCVVMPAYNASATLKATIDQIPMDYVDHMVLVDDASVDDTVAVAESLGIPFVRHEQNRGYGGNQKTCYDSALKLGADIIVMLHPDNQYNPRIIPNLVLPLALGQADVVLASRFIVDPLRGGPVVGGMPLLKYFLNRILTTFQNWMMGTYYSEFHTGYRAFSADALRAVDYQVCSEDFAFDNEILALFSALQLRIIQVGVETRYFKEASSIGLLRGMRYAFACMRVGIRYLLWRTGVVNWAWLEQGCRNAAHRPTHQNS
jgi:glycosyltransferase involved in cell wall biosynthesis